MSNHADSLQMPPDEAQSDDEPRPARHAGDATRERVRDRQLDEQEHAARVAAGRPRAWAFGTLLSAVYLVALMLTDTMGFPRDESFYFFAGEQYAGWFEELEHNIDQSRMADSFSRESIESHWNYNPEHPTLMKTLFGLSHQTLHEQRGWLSPSLAMRFPAMISAALMLLFTWMLAWEFFASMLAALSAALALALMPRLFFHAHLTCFDVPIAALWVVWVYCWYRALESRAWAWATGVVWGLGLLIKLNAFFLPFVALAHWALSNLRSFRWRDGLHIPRLPLALFTMALLGPIIFVAGWPRHWFDTFDRIGWYMKFHLKHEHYFQYFFGQSLWEPPFPVHFPFTMSATTTPVVTLALMLLGCALMLAYWLRDSRKARRIMQSQRGVGLLLAINLLLPILIIARPSTPIFGGVKHWFAALPFAAIFVGYAVMVLQRSAREHGGKLASHAATGTLLLSLCVPAGVATYQAVNVGTSYFNELVGGYTGAADRRGMRQFWGYASRLLMDDMNELLPPHTTVHFHNTTYFAVDFYKREGLLREDIAGRWDLGYADCTVFHHQKSFADFEYEIWSTYQTQTPLAVATIHGVPLASLYCRPGVVEP